MPPSPSFEARIKKPRYFTETTTMSDQTTDTRTERFVERYFALRSLGSTPRTELVAGVTTWRLFAQDPAKLAPWLNPQ